MKVMVPIFRATFDVTLQDSKSPARPRLQAVDLMGSRDFLTRESTEQALRTMLAPGSQVSKVRSVVVLTGRFYSLVIIINDEDVMMMMMSGNK